ncbi:hypothetical protein ACFPL7_11230 [Dongia soli]|uniref:STAS/SEC14 domain-containing protein n=1 Tax=Dongia soli TaxID=600628 RepID=A0ABU5ECB3_9PROT|nr:hypothetical protein [Dongia soli]MDY0883522.1 hypothetical protein [Dongia soli]
MISYGTSTGRITLRSDRGVLWIKLEREPQSADIVNCLRDAFAAGLVPTASPTVVDLLDFSGTIDWPAVRIIRGMLPADRGTEIGREVAPPSQRIAYVTRDPLFDTVLKIIGDLFGFARHRYFRDPERALLWACQSEPAGPVEDEDEEG